MKTAMEWVEYFQDKQPPAELAEQVAEIFAECQRDALEAAAKEANDHEFGSPIADAIRALAAPTQTVTAELPAYLRDDAPLATCSKCGRKSVIMAHGPGLRCRMQQPDGTHCDGVWRR